MKVLLVDDDPAILEVLGAFLRGAGFEVLEAEDGEKALELFPQADLVILDAKAAWTPAKSDLISKSGNNPLVGRALTGRVRATFVGGRQVFGA